MPSLPSLLNAIRAVRSERDMGEKEEQFYVGSDLCLVWLSDIGLLGNIIRTSLVGACNVYLVLRPMVQSDYPFLA